MRSSPVTGNLDGVELGREFSSEGRHCDDGGERHEVGYIRSVSVAGERVSADSCDSGWKSFGGFVFVEGSGDRG